MKLFKIYFKVCNNNKKMASSQCERKVSRFGFIIYDVVDWEINKQTNEIINSITSVSLVKALEATTRQYYNRSCFHCKLHIIFKRLLERNNCARNFNIQRKTRNISSLWKQMFEIQK